MQEKELVKRQIVKKIKAAGDILITSHIMPDGDNIGSVCALTGALRLSGYKVDCALFDAVPDILKFLPGSSDIKKLADIDRKYDLLIVLDSSSVDRTGVSDLGKYSDFIINIDHHVCNDNFGNINLVHTNYSATVQIVYELIKKARLKFNSDIATCLYCGLMTDTVGFQTSNTDENVFKMASSLVKCGASPNHISREMFQNKSMKNIIIIGKTLSSLNFIDNGLICWGKIDQKTIREVGALPSDCFGIVNQMISIKGVEVAILFNERPDGKTLVDFRSKTVIDVNKIANAFGGGGHLRASGATIEGNLNDIIAEVVNFAVEHIKTNYHSGLMKGTNTIESHSCGKQKGAKANTVVKSVGI
mgnify:CR=1 FL=1